MICLSLVKKVRHEEGEKKKSGELCLLNLFFKQVYEVVLYWQNTRVVVKNKTALGRPYGGRFGFG